MGVLVLLLLLGCSDDLPPADTPKNAEPAELKLPADLARRAEDPRPSILLVVLDTLRADAVSAYGAVEGTTPNFDALAARGVLYRHAYSAAPWTVSSHATLFSGLRIDEHGVGMTSNSMAPDSLVMLAESFADAGYVTAGFAENPLVGPLFNLQQGFEHFEVKPYLDGMTLGQAVKTARTKDDDAFGLVERVSAWAAQRDRARPYFVFVNIMDPHAPYRVRSENRWVPEDVGPSDVSYVAETYRVVAHALCGAVPSKKDVEILHGLYLGDVAAADAKLGRLIERSRSWEGSKRPLTVVTSDHGEHFGEHGLMSHLFSVRAPALHVPLVVEGLEGVAPSIVESAVGQDGLASALRCWALDEDCDAGWPLTESNESSATTKSGEEPPIFSFYSDATATMPPKVLETYEIPEGYEIVTPHRNHCRPEDRVFGEMVSMIRYPLKMNWVEDQPIELYDLSWDPAERSNLAEVRTEMASALRAELELHLRHHIQDREASSGEGLGEDQIRALKSLGYID